MAPSSLCISATLNTRTWIERQRKAQSRFPSDDEVEAHVKRHWPTLRPRELEYVAANAPRRNAAPEYMAFW